MLGYRCEYCDKRFTNAIDVVRHSAAVRLGRSIVAALLEREIDVCRYECTSVTEEFGSFGSKIAGTDGIALSYGKPHLALLYTLSEYTLARVLLAKTNSWSYIACALTVDPLAIYN
jgi:hypothetical protein